MYLGGGVAEPSPNLSRRNNGRGIGPFPLKEGGTEKIGGRQFSEATNSDSFEAVSRVIPWVSSIIRPNRIAAGIPTTDSAPTTIDSPPILWARAATAALEITEPAAL